MNASTFKAAANVIRTSYTKGGMEAVLIATASAIALLCEAEAERQEIAQKEHERQEMDAAIEGQPALKTLAVTGYSGTDIGRRVVYIGNRFAGKSADEPGVLKGISSGANSSTLFVVYDGSSNSKATNDWDLIWENDNE